MYKRRARVLFLETGAGATALMAMGWARHLGGDWLEVRCAGFKLYGANPHAAASMLTAGVDISRHECTHCSDALLEWADLVVILGGEVPTQCPPMPAGTQKKHWDLVDPARISGSEEQVMAAYLSACEQIRAHVASMIGGMRMLARSQVTLDGEGEA